MQNVQAVFRMLLAAQPGKGREALRHGDECSLVPSPSEEEERRAGEERERRSLGQLILVTAAAVE